MISLWALTSLSWMKATRVLRHHNERSLTLDDTTSNWKITSFVECIVVLRILVYNFRDVWLSISLGVDWPLGWLTTINLASLYVRLWLFVIADLLHMFDLLLNLTLTLLMCVLINNPDFLSILLLTLAALPHTAFLRVRVYAHIAPIPHGVRLPAQALWIWFAVAIKRLTLRISVFGLTWPTFRICLLYRWIG